MNPSERQVRIRRRLGRYLDRQREGYRGYLALLEQQRAAIGAGDADRLGHHAALEQEMIDCLASLQRAIDPLEELCRRSRPAEEPALARLRDTLGRLRGQALAGNRENRRLLAERLEALRQEIAEAARRGPRQGVSPYAGTVEPRLVDIRS